MKKQANPGLIPVINIDNKLTQITFFYDIHRTEDDGIWDHLESLVEFLKDVHEKYYSKYSSQPIIARAARTVDIERLAGQFLGTVENHSNKGSVRLTVCVSTQTGESEAYFIPEFLQYSIHWFEEGCDKLMSIFPVGFQTHHRYKLTEQALISGITFDLRVLLENVEASMEFFTESVIPNLDPYFNYLKHVYKSISDKDLAIDFADVSNTLAQTITTIYERRLNNPTEMSREILFLDTTITGTNKENCNLSMHLRGLTEITSTPNLFCGDPEYKANLVSEQDNIKSWNKMTIHQPAPTNDENSSAG